MTLTLDHVPFAYRSLDDARELFETVGLASDYGGVHENDATEMAVVGFEDDSYIELIAERADPAPHDYWPDAIATDAGPADWAVRVEDVLADCHRTLDAGEIVRGPFTEGRETPDGRRVEWDRAAYGPTDRSVLPFAIADRTPRSRRVTPTEPIDDCVTGIGTVVLATPTPEATIERLRERYRLATPSATEVAPFGEVWSAPGAPVAVVGPGKSWVDDRLAARPPGPCSCLLAVDELSAAQTAFPLTESRPWPDGQIALFDHDRLTPVLGVIERTG